MANPTSAESGSVSKQASRLSILLAVAMFVLVIDTSMMNVSISAVVDDLGVTVSDIQSAIALEALVSAAFILIGSKVSDLIGRKRAYILGLLGYAIGAIAMTFTQSMLPIIILWAIVGGLGAFAHGVQHLVGARLDAHGVERGRRERPVCAAGVRLRGRPGGSGEPEDQVGGR